jgi:hypothetical protein
MWINCPRCLKEHNRCSCQLADIVANNKSNAESLISMLLKKPTEEKPMEPKEMTAQDAWIAMAKGECVGTSYVPHRIWNNRLQYWDSKNWQGTETLDSGPYSIVPDPSKPEVSEFEQDRKNLIKHLDTATWKYSERPGDMVDMTLDFIEKHFQRKGEK